MKTNNWMLAFATVISLLILMKVTEKEPKSKKSCGCGKYKLFFILYKLLHRLCSIFLKIISRDI